MKEVVATKASKFERIVKWRSKAGRMMSSSTPSTSERKLLTAHSFSFAFSTGQPLPMQSFRGKTVLVVNTASRCGFTRQYADLQFLWQQYRQRGLVVLAVPSNDFGRQEPLRDTEVASYCATNFQIDFPITAKVHVRGEEAHPFYHWAADQLGSLSKPRWNFHKYLISHDGRLVDWFSTLTSPLSRRVKKAVEGQLKLTEIDTA